MGRLQLLVVEFSFAMLAYDYGGEGEDNDDDYNKSNDGGPPVCVDVDSYFIIDIFIVRANQMLVFLNLSL